MTAEKKKSGYFPSLALIIGLSTSSHLMIMNFKAQAASRLETLFFFLKQSVSLKLLVPAQLATSTPP